MYEGNVALNNIIRHHDVLVKLTVGIGGELRIFIVITIKSSYTVCGSDNFLQQCISY
jgi:hypothetical protein